MGRWRQRGRKYEIFHPKFGVLNKMILWDHVIWQFLLKNFEKKDQHSDFMDPANF